MKKRVVILGAGISGLSLAFFLSDHFEVTVLEKRKRAGGWLQTESTSGFLFERGPRTFRKAHSPLLLALIEELNLKGELIDSAPEAKRRYLWMDGHLQSFPKLLLKSAFLLPVLKEWAIPANRSDESISTFATRRFNREVAERLFDPLTLGIYAGEIDHLSMKACFPRLKQWEEEYGSVTLGFLAQKRSKEPSPLFSLKTGVQSLIDALVKRLEGKMRCNQEVKALRFSEQEVEVITQGGSLHADLLFSALPVHAIAELFQPHDALLGQELAAIRSKSLQVVHLGYSQRVLPLSGFGYLVPRREKEQILGVVFDSAIFPQHNHHQEETRLTVMLNDSPDPIAASVEALQRHLNISARPELSRSVSMQEAIPQYAVGHLERIAALQKRVQSLFPRCVLVGNYLTGISVEACIATAKTAADRALRKGTALEFEDASQIGVGLFQCS
jgi:protoporphyrinogen/coproporphyrinogen III oxidase